LEPEDLEDAYNILTSCYQVGSARDEIIIILFCGVTTLLTIYTAYKQVRQQGDLSAIVPGSTSANADFARLQEEED
jgi:hypothetical protein